MRRLPVLRMLFKPEASTKAADAASEKCRLSVVSRSAASFLSSRRGSPIVFDDTRKLLCCCRRWRRSKFRDQSQDSRRPLSSGTCPCPRLFSGPSSRTAALLGHLPPGSRVRAGACSAPTAHDFGRPILEIGGFHTGANRKSRIRPLHTFLDIKGF
jgi:hypothetical protein